MIGIVVRSDLVDEAAAPARIVYEVDADVDALQVHGGAVQVQHVHAAKEPLLAGAPCVELVVPGPATGDPRARR